MVCLGNICRSPLAEGIMRQKIEKYKLNALVDSAGTIANHVGQHPDSRSIANGLKHQVDISSLEARQFTKSDFDKFDLIYVMYPRTDLEVPDPYFGGDEGFEKVYHLLDLACENLAMNLAKH